MDYWLFQAIPERYDLPTKIAQLPSDAWLVTRFADQIKQQDIVYFWFGGPTAGILGWGVVQSQLPYLTDDGDYRVDVSYAEHLDNPISKEDARNDPVLQSLTVVRAPQGTNFRVKPEQARTLNDLIRQRGVSAPPDPPDDHGDGDG